MTGQSVEIFEIRPVWRGDPGGTREHPVAKATYVKSRGIWRVLWQRADLKWHCYEPKAEVSKELLEVLSEHIEHFRTGIGDEFAVDLPHRRSNQKKATRSISVSSHVACNKVAFELID